MTIDKKTEWRMAIDQKTERARLESVAVDSWYAKGVATSMVRYTGKVFSRYWKGTRCLELGPAEGLMTEVLAAAFPDLEVVDGSEQFCVNLRQRYPNASIHCSLFEDFEPAHQFDTIVLGHVLEHVESPRYLLQKVRSWLAPAGVVCAAVPNARSIHRQAAVLMGILPTEHSLNATDHHHGHRRVYDPESFRAEFLSAGLRIWIFGGYWLKPVSNAQLDATWTPDMVEAFMQLGERYPDIAGDIYIIATT